MGMATSRFYSLVEPAIDDKELAPSNRPSDDGKLAGLGVENTFL
jgi:hypothetical protein